MGTPGRGPARVSLGVGCFAEGCNEDAPRWKSIFGVRIRSRSRFMGADRPTETRMDSSGLRGRSSECSLLDRLVCALHRGESRSLVLRGEAGIGKTALLEYLVESASDTTVVWAAGVESEMELGFATL